ncbi:MAG: NAD-dependent epimerase/dehydratase family protein [Pseudomonadota bacterium]
MHLLITGAQGYVGRHVTAHALAAGHTVRATLRDTSLSEHLRDAIDASKDQLQTVQLDLLSDAGWAEAMTGIDAVLHTASPVPTTRAPSDDAILRPAVDGTTRVLRHARDAGISRVVVTSSIAAILGSPDKGAGDTYDAGDWTPTDDPKVRAYARSKTLAEQAARRIAADAPTMRLATVNPGFVFGPPLGGPVSSSLTLVDMLLRGRFPALFRISFPSVDAEDVAAAHLAALTAEDGARIIASGRTLWLPEMAQAVREAVPSARVTRFILPDWIVRQARRVSPTLREFAGNVGQAKYTDPSSCEALLGRPLKDPLLAVAATARALAA